MKLREFIGGPGMTAKVFDWAFWLSVLGGAGYACVRLQGDALLGILGLLLFAAAAIYLTRGRIRDSRTGTVFPTGVDWGNGLPTFRSHDGAAAGDDRKRGGDTSTSAQNARNDGTP